MLSAFTPKRENNFMTPRRRSLASNGKQKSGSGYTKLFGGTSNGAGFTRSLSSPSSLAGNSDAGTASPVRNAHSGSHMRTRNNTETDPPNSTELSESQVRQNYRMQFFRGLRAVRLRDRSERRFFQYVSETRQTRQLQICRNRGLHNVLATELEEKPRLRGHEYLSFLRDFRTSSVYQWRKRYDDSRNRFLNFKSKLPKALRVRLLHDKCFLWVDLGVDDRILNEEDLRRPLKMFRARDERKKIRFEQTIRRRNEQLWRVLFGRLAYGNRICISEIYSPDIEFDKDQGVPLEVMSSISISTFPSKLAESSMMSSQSSTCTSIVTLKSLPMDGPLLPCFYQAEQIVKDCFAPKGLEMTITGAFMESMSVDLLVVNDESTPFVVAAAEYVFLQNYLWVETLAVDQRLQGRGIGKAMITRFKEMAQKRSKILLLYAVNGTEKFYERNGFRICDRFENEQQRNWQEAIDDGDVAPGQTKFGTFMEWNPFVS